MPFLTFLSQARNLNLELSDQGLTRIIRVHSFQEPPKVNAKQTNSHNKWIYWLEAVKSRMDIIRNHISEREDKQA